MLPGLLTERANGQSGGIGWIQVTGRGYAQRRWSEPSCTRTVMNLELLLWSIPPLIFSVAFLGVRRYSLLNVARHVSGVAVVFGALALDVSAADDRPLLIFLGAIGGTLVGQAFEAEKRRAADRRRAVGLDGGEFRQVSRPT